jgi:predicted xylose isomerase-like sugar epimerase
VPSRIVRDELALEISQKLGIDSVVLRQELKHAATTRSATQVKATAEAQITGAERVLIRALASATQMQSAKRAVRREKERTRNSIPPGRRNMHCNRNICMRGWLRSR